MGQINTIFVSIERGGRHPFVVVAVETTTDGIRRYLSGYMITHDIKKIIDYPKKYTRLKENPNPKDIEPAYLCNVRINNLPQKMFSKPYKNWHLCEEDIRLIDKLEKKKKSSFRKIVSQ